MGTTARRTAAPRGRIWPIAAAVLVAAAACDGTDDREVSSFSQYAALCASPRVGIDPFTGRAYPDRGGTLADEKSWVGSWIDELYLWYREVPAVSAASYANPVAYFEALRTPAVTASGRPKDQFHFWVPTAEWAAFAQSGVEVGYGARWMLLAPVPPRRLVVAYTEPLSPAALAGIVRGTEVLSIDGADLVNGADASAVDTLNAGLAPRTAGETHVFVVRDPGGATRTVTLASANVEGTPVQGVRTIATATGDVGYVLFNDHVATAEALLVQAVQTLAAARVTDLVLDLRYNGGGYLDMASQLSFMIAGPSRTAGMTFERVIFNDKHPTTNPVTRRPLAPTPFHATTLGFSTTPGQALPSLGLGRVFVLSGPGTCSASEAIVNGLRGIGVQVVQVGGTTCGKPYGFYPADNCGVTYFAIQMQGVNHAGFGGYADGFAPGGAGPAGLPGCEVGDDFLHELGDPAEARLAAALRYRATGTCAGAAALTAGDPLSSAEGRLLRSPLRENRILGP